MKKGPGKNPENIKLVLQSETKIRKEEPKQNVYTVADEKERQKRGCLEVIRPQGDQEDKNIWRILRVIAMHS